MMVSDTASDLVRPAEDALETMSGSHPADLQRTSLAVLRAEWSTLAVVSTDARTNALDVANDLVGCARAYRLGVMRVVNGCMSAATQVPRLLDTLRETQGTEVRTVVALDDPLSNPDRMPLLFAADAAVLLVRLGTTTVKSVEAAMDLVGRDRVVGCIIVSR